MMGGTLVGLGIWSYIEKNKFQHHAAENISDVIFDISVVIIFLGGILFVVAFMGCLGALRENICLLKTVS